MTAAIVTLGLLAALAYGTSDFLGGIASRRCGSSLAVVALFKVVVLIALALAASLAGHAPARTEVVWGAVAGIAMGTAYMIYFRGLAVLARISRGRTIREFVAGTLILPATFMMAWMSIIGNSAIDLLMTGQADFGAQAVEMPGSSIYLFLENMPWAAVTTIAATVLAIIFFVTSGDSGSLVLSNLTSVIKDPNKDAPAWMRVLWAAIIGLLTLGLLVVDGLTALQSSVVVMGLPFAFVLFLMMIGVFRALRVEALKEDSDRASLAGYLTGRTAVADRAPGDWRQRLSRALSFPGRREMRRFMREEVRPAMEEIRRSLAERGYAVQITEGEADEEHLALNVKLEDAQDFTYQVWPRRLMTPSFAPRAHADTAEYYRLEVHLLEGGQGYDLMGYTQSQIIDNVLDQFERHLYFLQSQEQRGGTTPMPGENAEASGE